ncbi:hypothetical protein ACU635_51100 [[Actinomadura] parvosata]|uniref:hypothetical protein n=1 Tax=[Actinomadura] parvosata TaxID=1955412 RepID=UPI00406CE05A
MTTPRKPDDLDLLLMLADAMGGGDGGAAIEAAEARGQRELVNSEVIPAKGSDDLATLGFTLGEPIEGDPLFRKATLPEGWTRQASDHSMWSHIVDELGRRRVAMFYKAAFYDRRASCRAETVYSYVSSCLYEDREPILDDAWATRRAVLEALTSIEKQERESFEHWGARSDQYARERVQEIRAKLAKLNALQSRIGGGS